MFDIEKFEAKLLSIKKEKSTGYCMRHFRVAAQSAGFELSIYPTEAYLYINFLLESGANIINVKKLENYKPVVGDILIWNPNRIVKGGYIQAYTSLGWVSDFLQQDIFPNSMNILWIEGGYTILRFKL